MVVNLSPELRIVGDDGICFELQKLTKKGAKSKNAGAIAWKSMGYYASLEHACKAAVSKGLCSSIEEANSKEIIAAIAAAAEVIARACAQPEVKKTKKGGASVDAI